MDPRYAKVLGVMRANAVTGVQGPMTDAEAPRSERMTNDRILDPASVSLRNHAGLFLGCFFG